MYRILTIDDDEKYLDSLYEMLSLNYKVDKTTSAREGINLCRDNKYSLIIVDLSMSEISGLVFSELVQELFPPQNIVILSGVATAQEQIEILDKEIVDYIDKSLPPEVLLKRIERILKQLKTEDKLYSKKEKIELDRKNRVVYKDGSRIHLANKEFNLLSYFLLNKNQVLDRKDIYESVWGKELYTSNLRVVDVHVLKLRKEFDLKCITCERGVGYVWEE